MPRQYKERPFEVKGYGLVDFNLVRRGEVWVVRFNGLDGKQQRVSTKKEDKNQAYTEAGKIIFREFSPDLFAGAHRISWDELADKLRLKLAANNARKDTYYDYLKTINALRTTLPETKGPADITHALAVKFKEKYISTPYRKGPNGPERYRNHTTLNSFLRKANSIWSRWLIQEFGLMTVNPWLSVPKALTDRHRPKAPPEDLIAKFFTYLDARFGEWEFFKAFFRVKEVTGSRLADLCSLRADQFDGKAIEFDPGQTKNRAGRNFPLPPKVAELVGRVKGEVYLWDRYPVGMKAYRNKNARRRSAVNTEFGPVRLGRYAQQVMEDFSKLYGKRLTTHDFRKRAVTLMIEADKPPQVVADYFGMTLQNLLQNYLDKRKALPVVVYDEAATILSTL